MTASQLEQGQQTGHRRDDPPARRRTMQFAWCESALTRAKELEALCDSVTSEADQHVSGRLNGGRPPSTPSIAVKKSAILYHLDAAEQATREVEPASVLDPVLHPIRSLRSAARVERATSNLDAAEALLLNIVPADYVLGQMSSLLRHVRAHLTVNDARRQTFERIAAELGITGPEQTAAEPKLRDDLLRTVERNRGSIVTAVRGASTAALREQTRVRSFRNVVAITTLMMTILAAIIAAIGLRAPTMIPLCFAPQESGVAVVVCPTAQSDPFLTARTSTDPADADSEREDIDDAIGRTAKPTDILVVQLVGLTAAAVATASAIRTIRGSSERYGLPVALAILKLPTGAVTAFLGLLLMRGQFVPGLSALDTSAQILAWALVFGYAQQLFTHMVDRQGHSVLDDVRGADRQPARGGRPSGEE